MFHPRRPYFRFVDIFSLCVRYKIYGRLLILTSSLQEKIKLGTSKHQKVFKPACFGQ